jgi:hypothetical protein
MITPDGTDKALSHGNSPVTASRSIIFCARNSSKLVAFPGQTNAMSNPSVHYWQTFMPDALTGS